MGLGLFFEKARPERTCIGLLQSTLDGTRSVNLSAFLQMIKIKPVQHTSVYISLDIIIELDIEGEFLVSSLLDGSETDPILLEDDFDVLGLKNFKSNEYRMLILSPDGSGEMCITIYISGGLMIRFVWINGTMTCVRFVRLSASPRNTLPASRKCQPQKIL